MTASIKAGVRDLALGLQRAALWRTLAWHDLQRGNLRTRLGVLWHTLSFFIVVGALGYLYSDIMGRPREVYVPYIAAGFLVWRLISQNITEGLLAFSANAGFITQIPLPMTVFVFRSVCFRFYIFALNFLAFLLILFAFGLVPGIAVFTSLIGLLILLLTSVAVTLLLGTLSVFNPWMKNLIPSIVNLFFFVTPILWMPQMLSRGGDAAVVATQGREVAIHSALVTWNPLYHFVEILRAPLIGESVQPLSWAVTGCAAAVLMALAMMVFGHWRTRVLLRL